MNSIHPVVIASANGNRFRNGGDLTCVEKAFAEIIAGADVLDALIAGVNLNELDPEETSVGYGSLPNEEGVLQLDASVMHGPAKRAGAVAALEGVRTPSLVAKAVMEKTPHHLLVGRGAQAFARAQDFEIEDDLNSKNSREIWQEWKRRVALAGDLDGEARAAASHRVMQELVAEGLIDPQHIYGTINCNGINARGEICGVTTTSGTAWKMPGRAGDSPIFGAGLYVDGEVGAAGSTGRGESNLFSVSSFLIVENMRRGMHPKDAALEAARRVQQNTVEPRLLNARGLPNFGLNFYALNVRGEFAGVSMYPGAHYAVCTENGAETLLCEPLLDGRPED
ncbi:MAG: N(4)-(beta-N-acetylglucosaminyl)-L-asparaginase [Chthoniobacterales bacterium]|nr:N(4)-(beta-N-acetylglucosaminyl)-L-asparaginase [Chthoniobacterales bacterium]